MKIIKLNDGLYINANNLISIENMFLKEKTNTQECCIFIKVVFETYNVTAKLMSKEKIAKVIDINIGILDLGSVDSCVFCPNDKKCPFATNCENCEVNEEFTKDFIHYFKLPYNQNFIKNYLDRALYEELTSDKNIIDFTNINLYGAFDKSIDLNVEDKAIYRVTTGAEESIFKSELNLSKYKNYIMDKREGE